MWLRIASLASWRGWESETRNGAFHLAALPVAGVGQIEAAFYPRPVIVRFSDFKTNEYAGLLGGEAFEPKESNPMIGFRGASRYDDPKYREGFALECAAVRKVRDEMGLSTKAKRCSMRWPETA